ncbi:assimilatory sulfite reductase (NADPH) flavoprotein subunit [Ruficoccus amylovorans]|uniref:assimilatory sulfite reductase (NADPH) n=1 Tax=Ruficoccus amylovorans TaxID=1804625 RepID=A0A842HFL7_9BACT|nr:assimilatory sulfite reductase (NADPH) flavoprotein subunit [Ruficoccus amylovorans]MBC2595313.1 assimilatory sulfite reductase (NADPH) flavoprotein subunit [Ruficoccus amylovorans]
MQLPDQAPFNAEQKASLEKALGTLSPEQNTWLSGFLAGAGAALQSASAAAPVHHHPSKGVPLTILFGTESGNCEELAGRAKEIAENQGFMPTVRDMGSFTPESLAKETNLAVIVSTWGEGDPPDSASTFYKAVMDKSCPRLEQSRFSVLALGDTSYEHFCKIGRDFDQRLEDLGAKRYYPRTDCDVDYEEPFQKWLEGALKSLAKVARPEPARAVVVNGAASKSAPVPSPAANGLVYDKKNPFPALLKERILLNGTGSIKETWHLELSLEGSGMSYEPGDALALIPANSQDVVDAIIDSCCFDPRERVTGNAGSEVTLREALTRHYDITGLSKNVLKKYNEKAASDKITHLLDPENKDELHNYLWGRQVVDMLEDFPLKGLTGGELVSILRKMPPRLYSIASSFRAHPDEVHLTIAAVRYESHGRQRKGVASTFIADDLSAGGTVPVYTHKNKNFRLPEDSDTPIIMVGPGTGIAPFRSFIEERAVNGDKGANWLFFGDQRYNYDFLYQLEWQDYLKKGVLTKLDVAFSRDQPEKIYVQDRLLQQGKEVYRWLEEGAHFYVCGDANRMAVDVHNALLKIAQEAGGKSEEQAQTWFEDLRKQKRYQRDVY